MLRVKADELRKGDLIFYKDAYFEIVSDKRWDVLPLTNLRSPAVMARCFMCPTYRHTDPVGLVVGSYRYIPISKEVLLLSSL